MARTAMTECRTRRSSGLVVFVATLLLGGCGFHLQGAYRLPEGVEALNVVYSNAYRVGDPPLIDALKQRLRAGGKLGGAGADARLVIERIDNDRDVMSISPIDGSVAEYELHSEVVFDYIVAGRTLLDDERFSVTRFYSNSDTTSLAAGAERRELLARMQARLADRMLFRIKQVTARHME